jgi:hypothetical protein
VAVWKASTGPDHQDLVLASRIVGRKADVMTRDSLHKVLRARIEATALQVF